MTMSEADAGALRRYGAALLERAATFALEALDESPLTARELLRPTPCEGWDLGMLLLHLEDSLAALHEAVTTGTVGLCPSGVDGPEDLVAAVRAGARRLAGVWGDPDRTVTVGGCSVGAGVVAGTGAVELAVHGWDIARARGGGAQIPVPLAERLLRLAPLLVPGHARSGLFGPPVTAPPSASPGERLVAYLGRDPRSGQARTA